MSRERGVERQARAAHAGKRSSPPAVRGRANSDARDYTPPGVLHAQAMRFCAVNPKSPLEIEQASG